MAQCRSPKWLGELIEVTREYRLVRRTLQDLNRPAFWSLILVLMLGLLALGPGVAELGLRSTGTGLRGLQFLFVSVMLPLVVLSIPLFHRVSLRESNELDFRRIQLGATPLIRLTEMMVYAGLIAIPLGLTGLLEYGFTLNQGGPLRNFTAFWGMTLGLGGVLVFLGWFLAEFASTRFEASVLLFVLWLVLVLGWDIVMVLLVVLDVPSELVSTLAVLNPVGLYRFELYRLLPELRPALEGHLPGLIYHWIGRLVWGVVLPTWVVLRDDS